MRQPDKAQLAFDELDARTKCEFLAICYRDLQEADEAIDLFTTDLKLPKLQGDLWRRCAAETAIVRYARPFFHSYVSDKLKVKLPDSYRASFSVEQEKLHQLIYEARSSVVGHSDIGYSEVKQFQIQPPGTEHRLHSGLVSKFQSEEIKNLAQMTELIQELYSSINWSLQHFGDEAGEFITPAKKSPPYEVKS